MASNERANQQLGLDIEEAVARERDAEHLGDSGGWFDVDDDGTPVEVKSTEKRLQSGRRGRYQLIESNHANLRDHGGEYVFVLREGDSEVDRTTVTPSEIDDYVQAEDRKWPRGSKLKIPWTEVHDAA